MQKQAVKKELEVIVNQIRKYVPALRPYFEDERTILEYSNNLRDFEVLPLHEERQELVRKKIDSKFSQLFGADYQQELNVNLSETSALNIVDHHQVFNNPLIISSNFIANVEKFFREEKQNAILVVSSGDVPPNNFFSKNGFEFSGTRVPLFSNREKEYTSYYIPKRQFNFTQRLKDIGRWVEFGKSEQEFLIAEEQRFQSIDYGNCDNYIDQISLIVKETWPLLYEEKLRRNLPEVLYITQEELITECLIDLLEDDNFISASLFQKDIREKVLDNFRGIVVAWREDEGKGTHFFWRKHPKEPRSLRMWLENGWLIPEDERYADLKIQLEKDTIVELLRQREIYPSLFLIFSVLNFYAGVKPYCGYGSVSYLTFFKDAWIKSLEGSKYSDELPLIKSVDTTGFVGGLPIFFERSDGEIKTLFAYDVFFRGGMSQEYLNKVTSMKFSDLVTIASADMYAYQSSKYIPAGERIRPTIDFDDIAALVFDWL